MSRSSRPPNGLTPSALCFFPTVVALTALIQSSSVPVSHVPPGARCRPYLPASPPLTAAPVPILTRQAFRWSDVRRWRELETRLNSDSGYVRCGAEWYAPQGPNHKSRPTSAKTLNIIGFFRRLTFFRRDIDRPSQYNLAVLFDWKHAENGQPSARVSGQLVPDS